MASMKYLWPIDNEVSAETIHAYDQAVGAKKESNLAHLVGLIDKKVPIPPRAYLTSAAGDMNPQRPDDAFMRELGGAVARFEKLLHAKLGSKDAPMLLTVQGDFCGAVRNIGCSLKSLRALVYHYGPATAYTVYVDFLESFSTLVLGAPHTDFRSMFGIEAQREGGAGGLASLTEDDFASKVTSYQNLISQKIGKAFPDAPERSLIMTVMHCALAGKEAGGDEIFIKAQMMPTLDGHSAKGVAFTRNPFTGKKDIYGVYQAGPEGKKFQIEPEENPEGAPVEHNAFRDKFPAQYGELRRYLPEVEASYRDVMEVEFVTDADGHLFFTTFDRASVTARAGVIAAVDLNREGRITDLEAALRVKPKDLEVLLHPTLDDVSRRKLEDLGSAGVTAAPGTSVGRVFFKMADAMEHYRNAVKNKQDKRVILIADELLISDTPGLGIINGLVTRASGIASHAAVMARANGIPCMVGYKGLELVPEKNVMKVNGREFAAGTLMTLEAGAEGRLYLGEGSLQNLSFQEGVVKDVAQLITRVLKKERVPVEVRVNINGAKDAETGLSFGADGVGLCRTENMFMEAEALREIRNIVFTQDIEMCGDSLKKLEETQFEDFKKIFLAMRDRTVNVRLMDMPLHDLAPQTEEGFKELCAALPHLSPEHLRVVGEGLREHNPMLGLRACRFGLISPPVYNMQIRAIVRAAYAVGQTGVVVKPGIMFPLVFSEEELSQLRARVVEIEKQVREEMRVAHDQKIRFKVGSMIELPAAALNADHLAKIGEFFAFGTNDLSQTTLGMSRDDSAHYLPFYIEKNLIPADPFKVLAEPVRQLIEIAVTRGHRVRHDVSFGICGEQGGDASTLRFCLEKGLNYVSCSPFRVLPVRAALVQAALAGDRPWAEALTSDELVASPAQSNGSGGKAHAARPVSPSVGRAA